MILKCLIVDEKGVVGPAIPIVQGETKVLNIFWFNKNGSPYIAATVATLVAKVRAQLNMAPISKSVGGGITLLECIQLTGFIGFQLTLDAADTALMAPNATLPLSWSMTDGTGGVTEGDIADAFDVSLPLVP